MKRLALLTLLAAGCAWAAQEEPHEAAPHQAAARQGGGHESGDPQLPAKWLNFAILAGGLGFLAVKLGGPAFKAQQQGILDGLNQAARRAEAAAAESATIEAKVAGLDGDVERMRQKAQAEMVAEARRIEEETAQMLAKVELAAEQEIASAGKFAQQELKATAAALALELAEQKLRARMDSATEGRLIARFVQGLENRQ